MSGSLIEDGLEVKVEFLNGADVARKDDEVREI